MRPAVLYVCYYHITEPLVQTQVVAYLRELARREFAVHLLTFERQRLSAEERRCIGDDLGRDGIRWHALRYHRWPSLPATLYDVVRGVVKAWGVGAAHDIALYHGRSDIGAAIGLAAKWIRGGKLLFDVRGLLADEYADSGHWRRGSVKYRLTRALERRLFERADALVVLTRALKRELTGANGLLRDREDDIEVIPCCTRVELFAHARQARAEERARRGWTGRRVIAYVGKLGGWYLAREMAEFFAVARAGDPRFFFQALTQSDPEELRSHLVGMRVPEDAYDICCVSPDEVPGALAAADAGLSFRRTKAPGAREAGPSAEGVSPTKVAEYLAAGLPVVSTRGIGDCDQILGDGKLGVLLERLDEAGYRRAVRALVELLGDADTPRRCHDFAAREFSIRTVGGARYVSLYRRLLAGADRRGAVAASQIGAPGA